MKLGVSVFTANDEKLLTDSIPDKIYFGDGPHLSENACGTEPTDSTVSPYRS
jgi:hypothetical protein